MIPIFVILGKSNIGKSLFFNKINFSSNLICFDYKFLTLKRSYNLNILNSFKYFLIDTVGVDFFIKFNINLNLFIQESDVILLILDCSFNNFFYEDKIFFYFLKKNKKNIFLIFNKIDCLKFNLGLLNFFKNIFNKPFLISSLSNFNIFKTINIFLNLFCFFKKCLYLKIYKKIIISLIGYTKVGKTIFINSFFNEKEFLKKTRDFFYLNYRFNKNIYSLFDTFSFNFNKNINKIEKISLFKTIKSIIISKIILFFIDPLNIFFLKDLLLFKFILKFFKSIIILINKSDLINISFKIRYKNFLKKKFNLYFFYTLYISSLKKINFIYITFFIDKIYKLNYKYIKTKNINKIIFNFNNFLKLKNFKKVRFLYANQEVKTPSLIIIRGKNLFFLKDYFYYFFKKKIFFFLKLKSLFVKIIYLCY